MKYRTNQYHLWASQILVGWQQ